MPILSRERERPHGEALRIESASLTLRLSFSILCQDVPFALFYLLSPDSKSTYLAGAAGIGNGHRPGPLPNGRGTPRRPYLRGIGAGKGSTLFLTRPDVMPR